MLHRKGKDKNLEIKEMNHLKVVKEAKIERRQMDQEIRALQLLTIEEKEKVEKKITAMIMLIMVILKLITCNNQMDVTQKIMNLLIIKMIMIHNNKILIKLISKKIS